MKTVTRFTAFLTVLASLILFACSGGEGGTGATANSSDVSVGQITGFGSIFVNGVEFETTSSVISKEGVLIPGGSQNDLKLGMVVTVKGTINPDGLTGTADSVSVKEVIKGVVQTNNMVDTLTVMGQTIEVSAATLFSDINIADITGIFPGDVVEVSGFVKANGIISAARIELSDSTESKLFGTVMNLDTNLKIFYVGTLIVNYLNADISDVANGALVNGQFVEIKGNFDSMVNVLDAVQIEQEQFNDNEVDEIEVEGFVTSVTSATNFSVNNMPVQVDSSTVYEGGVAADIVEGVFIEVEGMLVNGVLIADEVEFGDAVRVEAEIESISINANTLTLVGINGLVIKTNTFTEFSDSITGLGDLMPGNVVKVRGYPLNNNTTVIARQVELSDSTDIAFQGPVTDKTDMPNSFDLLGVKISTISIIEDKFKQDDIAIGSTRFYNAIAIGSIVELVGQLDLGVITWLEVEVEN